MLIKIFILNWDNPRSSRSVYRTEMSGKIQASHEPLPREWYERHSRPTYLLRQDLWNAPRPPFHPSASTGIRAWKDVPAWPVDT